jgi:hypothetical protein
MRIPSADTLLAFFSVIPAVEEPLDGLYVYEVDFRGGLALRFSVSRTEGSVQVAIVNGETPLLVVSQEGASQLSIVTKDGFSSLIAEFDFGGGSGRLELTLEPAPKVHWYTLAEPDRLRG